MKLSFRQQQSGSVLLITVATAAVIGITLVAYLRMVEAQNQSVARSQTWNSGIPAAEAGIEEAMAHLNVVLDGNRAVAGWTSNVTDYSKSGTIGDARYSVSISLGSPPVIISKGYAKAPITGTEILRTVKVTTSRTSTGNKGLVAKGGIELVGNILMDSFDSADPAYNTNGRYDIAKSKDNGFVGSVESSISGGGGAIYGSAATGPTGSASGAGTIGDAAWNNGGNTGIQTGHYANDLNVSFPAVTLPDMSGAQSPGSGTIVLTNITSTVSNVTSTTYPSSFSGSVITNTGGTALTVTTWPGSGVGTVKTNTSPAHQASYPASGTYIGTVVTNIVTSGPKASRGTFYDYTGINSYTYTNYSSTYTYSQVFTNAAYTTNTYSPLLRSGNYYSYSVSMTGGEALVTGDCVWYIETTFKMSGQAKITILPGGSLTMYFGGDADLKGNGIINGTMDATKFNIKGLPTCTDISYGGNASFTGTMYAPSAYLHLGGGGNDLYDFVGAATVGQAKLNGHFNFHYDELLGRIGGVTEWNIASWNEL